MKVKSFGGLFLAWFVFCTVASCSVLGFIAWAIYRLVEAYT